MAAALSLPALDALSGEQRMLFGNVRWSDYVLLSETLDIPGLRLTFYKGYLEVMSPSFEHEFWKKSAARLIELYAFLARLPLFAYGSTTFRNEAKERGVEPDECWNVGTAMRKGDAPHIVLEVVHKSPLLDKLAVYDGLGVGEVWRFEGGRFYIYWRRSEGGYEAAERSALLPELDFTRVAPFVVREDQDQALHEFADQLFT